jgi:hypothetical protein
MPPYTMNDRFSGTRMTQRMISSYEYEVTGEIHQINDIQSYPSGFRLREFVLLDESYNPQPLVFKILQDKVDALDVFKEGDRVRVVFELKGKFGEGQWAGRIFTNLEALSIEAAETEKTELSSNRKGISVEEEEIDEDVQF